MVALRSAPYRPFSTGLLIAACHLLLVTLAVAQVRFYPDDPLWKMPPPLQVQDAADTSINGLYDFLYQSFRPAAVEDTPAGAINTLGEVPDSLWFTNRHAHSRMSRDELQRGPGDHLLPLPPFTVVGGKADGITPGFRLRDAAGRLYFIKPDPLSNPEMASGVEMLGSRFFYALGYNTPQNYLIYVRRQDLTISPKATVGSGSRSRRMLPRDLDIIFRRVPRRPDGTYRLLASLALPGKPLGPFRYEGVRSDDPNDVVPHQDRRDLRGLGVFAAWLNHTDTKGQNSMSVLETFEGRRVIRHYLLDFGSILGSDSDMAKNARFGADYAMPRGKEVLSKMVTLGLRTESWERARYSTHPAIGRFGSDHFDPQNWASNYPNPAFLRSRPDDQFWAAKIVMAFTNDDIRAIVETGDYSDPAVVSTLTTLLAERRDRIGRTYFSKVLPLDSFEVRDGELRFVDLAAKHGFAPTPPLVVSWSQFDNRTGRHQPLDGTSGWRLPQEAYNTPEGCYFAASISASPDPRTVTVFLRRTATGFDVVGIDRTW
jgi:hypothetical protein